MPRMVKESLSAIERTPASPSALSSGLWDVVSHSISSRVKVEGFNLETGEYRIVLQGTLDLEPNNNTP